MTSTDPPENENYSLTEDIGEGVYNPRQLSEGMVATTNRLALRIDERTDIEEPLRIAVRFFLISIMVTHESIIAVLRHKNTQKFDGDRTKLAVTTHGPDAMLLVRDQLEKVFSVALLLHGDPEWAAIYQQDDWRRRYEKHLYERQEKRKLERFAEFHEITAPEILERLRVGLGISDEQKQWVEFKFDHPGKKPPASLKGKEVKQFPTAGPIKDELKHTVVGPMLQRLHTEYKYLSGYTHSGAIKMDLLAMSDRLFKAPPEAMEKYFEKEIVNTAITLSLCSSVAACTEAFSFFSADLDTLALLTKQWEGLKRVNLLSRTLWDVRGSMAMGHNLTSPESRS